MREDQERIELDEIVHPLDPDEASGLILRILAEGRTVLIHHAKQRMDSRSLRSVDIANVLRAGTVEFPNGANEKGKWRYRVCTSRMTVVIEFRSRTCLVVVTTWRNG